MRPHCSRNRFRCRSATRRARSLSSVSSASVPRCAKAPEGRLVREVTELRDHLVARAVGARRSQLATVVVCEADAVLLATAHAFDRREEEVVVGEAEMRREEAI